MASQANAESEQPLDRPDEVATPAASPTNATKKRLWLGFSAEHLRSNLNLEARRERKNAGKNTLATDRGDGEEPENIENLDEVAAPEPVDPALEDARGHLEDRSDESPVKRGGRPFSRTATEIYTVSYLVLFSIFGTLARVGLQALTSYPGAPVLTGLLWANVGGSLIMGLLAEDRKLFQEEWGDKALEKLGNGTDIEKRQIQGRDSLEHKRHGAAKKTLPLYIGLATGLCGSFTSFSSFMRDAFYALANALPAPINHPSSAPISHTINVHRNPGYSFLATLGVLISTVGLSLGALQVGAHLALGLDRFTPSIPFLSTRKIFDPLVVLLAAGCWLAAIFMAIFPPDRPGGPVGNATWNQETWRSQSLFALVFAPPGCLLRFYVSVHLNDKIKSFPLGTFSVNVVGSALEAMFIDLQRAPIGGRIGCQVLQGMTDGFCGCLTTVSTWVIELRGLRTRHAYFYGVMSVAMGFSLYVIITGSLMWTRGFAVSRCMS